MVQWSTRARNANMKRIKQNRPKHLEIPMAWFKNNFILLLEIEQKCSSLILFYLLGKLKFGKKNSVPLSDTSVASLARNTNCSRNIIMNSIRIFKKLGLIEVKKIRGMSGGFKNRYSIDEKVFEKISVMDLNGLSNWFGRRIKMSKEKIIATKSSQSPSELKKLSGWKKKTRHPELWSVRNFLGYYLFKFKELYGYEDPEFCGIKPARFFDDQCFRIRSFVSGLPEKNKVLCKDYVDWLFEKVQEPGYWFKDRILGFDSVFSMKKKYFLKQFMGEEHKIKKKTLKEHLIERGE